MKMMVYCYTKLKEANFYVVALMVAVSNKKPHLDDGDYVVSDDEGVGQSKKGVELGDDQSAGLHKEETRLDDPGEELYEEEEEISHEVEAEDLELDQETGLEDEGKEAAHSSSSM